MIRSPYGFETGPYLLRAFVVTASICALAGTQKSWGSESPAGTGFPDPLLSPAGELAPTEPPSPASIGMVGSGFATNETPFTPSVTSTPPLPTGTPTSSPTATSTPTDTPTVTPTPYAFISGIVFEDSVEPNGIRDPGEPGLEGVFIELFQDEIPDPVQSTTTDPSGEFTFQLAAPGDYLVKETDPPGYVSTSPNGFAVVVEQSRIYTVFFADVMPVPASMIFGTVFEDLDSDGIWDSGETGLAGVTVELVFENTPIPVQTNSIGSYTFAVEPSTFYTVREIDPDGYRSTTPNDVNILVGQGMSYLINFADTPTNSPGAVIYGTVFNDVDENGARGPDELGMPDIAVELAESTGTTLSSALTDSFGRYTFPLPSPGSYRVVETSPICHLSTTGNSVDLSVVDHESRILDFGESGVGCDYGDAPDPPYQTLHANDGARHSPGSVYLGSIVDWEEDGQPSASADGDDLGAADDEDGVTFSTLLVAGETASVDIVASTAAFLQAWMDFTSDGDWADPGEQIFADELIPAGTSSLTLSVPASVVGEVTTYARFRFSTVAGGSFSGTLPDGEVEDYPVRILQPTPTPTSTPTSTPTPTPTLTPTPTPRFRFDCSDINGDGLVDDLDLLLFLEDWHRGLNLAPVPTPKHECSDIDGNGFVDDEDLFWLMWDWRLRVGPTPTPVVPGR